MIRFLPAIALVALCWIVFLANNGLGGSRLTRYGIVPRDWHSLAGILWAPFLHASFEHLVANTVPLLVLGLILCARSRVEFKVITAAGVLLTGALTWLFARSGCHIGASGLIFCLFGYLASLAFFRRTVGALLISVACIIGYGGLLRGVLPSSSEAVSWEGHLAGLVSGIALGWMSAQFQRAEARSEPAQLR
ncbi:MAG TPA: rhomboid family intramembrane serine protease [Verrucomicrobiae bacterium]